MKVVLEKSKLNGSIEIIGSKSYAHRYLIAQFLSLDKGVISNVPNSNDVKATLSCLNSLGATYKQDGNKVIFDKTNSKILIDWCNDMLAKHKEYIAENDCFEKIIFVGFNDEVVNAYEKILKI